MSKIKTSELFNCKTEYLCELFDNSQYPWEILPKIKSKAEELLEKGLIGYKLISENVLVGENVKIWGRIQSREYQKKIDEENIITKTAYEISISKMDVSSKPDIQFEII